MKHKALGTEGLLAAFIVAAALALINFFLGHPQHLEGNMGICLPSPNLWPIPPLWSWIANLSLMLIIGVTVHFVNKSYSIVQTTDTVLPAAFLVFCASNPWLSGLLNTSMIMAIINVLAIIMMFECYRARNATQQIFIVATMLSVGSMFQYAFIFMIPAYLIIALMMKCLRFKEFIAFLLGLAAPYWVGIGLGLIPLSSFSTPTLTNLFDGFTSTSDLLIGLLNIGITAIIAILMTLNNAVKLYAGNTRRRLYNNSISLLGLVCIICMSIDFNNLTAYVATFYLTAAVQLANTYALWNIPKGSLWLAVVAALYIASFAVMLW